MSRLRKALGLVAIGVAVQGAPSIEAQQATANLQVTASVKKQCTITTTPVNFGAYDPIVTNKASNLDQQGTVVVTCTKGAGAKVWLALGSNASGSTRRMQGPDAAAFLSYELYKDASRSSVWGNDDTTGLDVPPATTANPQTFTVYGRVPSGQDATVGNYADTVVATVNF